MAARRPWLIVERLGDEILVYDQRTHRAHALSGAAAWLFEHDDTTRPCAYSQRELDGARSALEHAHLDVLADPRRSRRRFLAAVATSTLVATLAVPRPAEATSACPGAVANNMCTTMTVGAPCVTVLGTCTGHCAICVVVGGHASCGCL